MLPEQFNNNLEKKGETTVKRFTKIITNENDYIRVLTEDIKALALVEDIPYVVIKDSLNDNTLTKLVIASMKEYYILTAMLDKL